MSQQYTRAQLEAMTSAELVKIYNTIASKQIKRFSSRKAGIKQLLNALAARAKTAGPTVRTIRDGKPATEKTGKAGRPQVAFSVKLLGEGKSEVRGGSLRGKLIAHLKTVEGNTATITELESKLGDKVRGVIQKLTSVGWLQRIEAP